MTDRNYERIAEAIAYLTHHADEQPSLDDVANQTGLSSFHFQRLFKKYAGVTPKQFVAHLTLDRAKALLAGGRSVLDAAYDVGLSSPARLHDHFITLEAVTPGEFKSGGEALAITYGFAPSPLGMTFVAQTPRGICRLVFVDGNGDDEIATLSRDWPHAALHRDDLGAQAAIATIFDAESGDATPLRLHVRGTNWQVRVWRALLDIPEGALSSYGRIARELRKPQASRAVGSAIASNPVAVLIPCHRVIASSGALCGYHWGTDRKRALLAMEAARSDRQTA